jgi:hypothetical protein
MRQIALKLADIRMLPQSLTLVQLRQLKKAIPELDLNL